MQKSTTFADSSITDEKQPDMFVVRMEQVTTGPTPDFDEFRLVFSYNTPDVTFYRRDMYSKIFPKYFGDELNGPNLISSVKIHEKTFFICGNIKKVFSGLMKYADNIDARYMSEDERKRLTKNIGASNDS